MVIFLFCITQFSHYTRVAMVKNFIYFANQYTFCKANTMKILWSIKLCLSDSKA